MDSPLSRVVFGTTRLGDSEIPFDQRVATARRALQVGLSIHTSHQYGDALAVLHAATDLEQPASVTTIVKLGWGSLEEIRGQLDLHRRGLGLDVIEVGQLCLGEPLASQLRRGGPVLDGLRELRAERHVRRFVLEVFPWTAQVAADAIRGGHADKLIDGYIFYFNPLQRFAPTALFDLLVEHDLPIISMRTLCGGSLASLMSSDSYLAPRAAAVAPLLAEAGSASWSEFCLHYLFSLPQVTSTVFATSKADRVDALLAAANHITPLDPDVLARLDALQAQWSAQYDAHAEPWSM